jgi:hypothetical protein
VRAALRSQAQASSSPFAGGTAMAGRAAKGGSPQVPKGSKQRKETEEILDQGKDPSVRSPQHTDYTVPAQ